MGLLETSSVATRFLLAEMEYIRLINQIADFESQPSKGISPAELEAVRAAKARRDALEKRMLEIWETESGRKAGLDGPAEMAPGT